MLDMEQREVDLLEFEELRRSETTDKLPFLDRENTHTSHTHTQKAQWSKQSSKAVKSD